MTTENQRLRCLTCNGKGTVMTHMLEQLEECPSCKGSGEQLKAQSDVGSGTLVRCAACKWWGEELDWMEKGVDVRFCKHPMVCQPSYGERNNRIMRADGVYTCDEGGCTGELITGPEFGCVHGETASTPNAEFRNAASGAPGLDGGVQ